MLAVKGQQDFGTSHFTPDYIRQALLSGRFDLYLSIEINL